jgi:ectoine hydroxylase-related dioxygenase (phytanoyl-CoA dioxygenase family)
VNVAGSGFGEEPPELERAKLTWRPWDRLRSKSATRLTFRVSWCAEVFWVPTSCPKFHRTIDRLDLPTPGADIASQRFSRFLQHEVFRTLMDHEAVVQPVVELCGPTVRLDHCYGITMSPGTIGLGLHGGAVPHDPAQFYNVQDGHTFNGLVAVQLALVDHPKGVGGFCCVLESHKANFALPEPHDLSWVLGVELRAGDVVFFSEALTHGTMPWLGPAQRRSLFFKYTPGFLAWGRNYESELNDPELLSLLTDRQRLLLQSPAVHPHEPVIAFETPRQRYPQPKK